MTPEALESAGWTVLAWPDGGWYAQSPTGKLAAIADAAGGITYLIPRLVPEPKVVQGFRP